MIFARRHLGHDTENSASEVKSWCVFTFHSTSNALFKSYLSRDGRILSWEHMVFLGPKWAKVSLFKDIIPLSLTQTFSRTAKPVNPYCGLPCKKLSEIPSLNLQGSGDSCHLVPVYFSARYP